jgi:hypothetical protein
MHGLGDPVTHFWRVQDMVRATGVDLAAARRKGQLSTGDWSAMVTRCRGCRWSGRCARWLATMDMGEAAEVPPACANRAVFDTLRDPA